MSKTKIPSDWIEKIRKTINLVDVIGESVVLKRSGVNHVGLCPFHAERSPSFSVNESKQLYHCFGCKAGGDAFSYMQELHGLSFREAIEELAERGQLKLPTELLGSEGEGEEARERQKQEQLAYKLNRFAAAFYRAHLEKDSKAQAYLRDRKVSELLSRNFYVGVSPGSSSEALALHLQGAKAPLSVAEKLGLIRPSKMQARSQTGYFDLFRNRVVFPILNTRGKVSGFGGRIFTEESGPKYLNSPDSPVFQKSKLAFGLFQAQKHIREADETILVEGYFDVLALHEAGFENTVAVCGTSLTREHIRIFQRFGKQITVLFDGDHAGRDAMERAMVTGLEVGVAIRGALLPDGLDPDDVLNQGEEGKEKLRHVHAAAQPILDLKISELTSLAQGGAEGQTEAVKKVAAWLNLYQDPVGKQVRVEQVQKEWGISQAVLQQALRGAPENQRTSASLGKAGPQKIEIRGRPQVPSQIPSQIHSNPPKIKVTLNRSEEQQRAFPPVSEGERFLFEAFLQWEHFSHLFEDVSPNLPPELGFWGLFEHPHLKDWVKKMVSTPGFPDDFHDISTSLVGPGIIPQLRSIIAQCLLRKQPVASADEVQRALGKANLKSWARFSQNLRAAINEAERQSDREQQIRLMQEYLDVQRKMKEFKAFHEEV
jgi:DNA primase